MTVHKCIATKSCVSNTRGGAEHRPQQRLEKDFEQAEASVPALLEIATGLNVSLSPRCANMWFLGPLVWLQMSLCNPVVALLFSIQVLPCVLHPSACDRSNVRHVSDACKAAARGGLKGNVVMGLGCLSEPQRKPGCMSQNDALLSNVRCVAAELALGNATARTGLGFSVTV